MARSITSPEAHFRRRLIIVVDRAGHAQHLREVPAAAVSAEEISQAAVQVFGDLLATLPQADEAAGRTFDGDGWTRLCLAWIDRVEVGPQQCWQHGVFLQAFLRRKSVR